VFLLSFGIGSFSRDQAGLILQPKECGFSLPAGYFADKQKYRLEDRRVDAGNPSNDGIISEESRRFLFDSSSGCMLYFVPSVLRYANMQTAITHHNNG